ncbi:hypothetical protein [Luteococcus peritonei]|uniref:MAPEG family protein n=1 Tax=Luteococcus peritonei TaxID=88874 RepID=A0ABW4RVJ3_9ACTN
MSPLLLDVLQAAVVALLGALAVLAGGPLVQTVFARVDREARLARERRGGAPTQADGARVCASPEPAPARGQGVVEAARVLPGGTWIGMLERLAIYAGLVAHYPEAIAICLALKGLARYPELKATTTGAAERFIIGTFVSVLVACGCAGLALWLAGPVLDWLL